MSLAIVELKLVPVMVTLDPTAPEPGLKPEIVGGGTTVNVLLLVADVGTFKTATEIVPVVAPVGTVTTS